MIRALISFLASILTAVQAFLLYTKGQGVCFNDGCEIVDSLTAVSPLFFNIAGFLYFQTLFWLLLWGRSGSEYWHKLARLLLLAGLVAEAVLIFFQYRIAMVFCSYCLIIFSFILLLNMLCGLRQMLRGAVLFSAVLVACFSLRFGPGAEKPPSLESGSVAMLAGEQDGVDRYLFFSSTCSHCENILESLKEQNVCSFRFNPVDRFDAFQFSGAEFSASYDPTVNSSFLKVLSVTGVPALVAREKEKTLVLQGKQQIMKYLDENCRPEMKEVDYSGTSTVSPPAYMSPQGLQPAEDDACPVDLECEEEQPEEIPAQ
ncbi:MAG: hypothetical protein VR65_13270 [Desulfobulbaceae bacterium BRH_c16a]|nr:MAG: hypothetical protein VR65_13270 [Desulfobulbaceae bacterium BRH_c16a]